MTEKEIDAMEAGREMDAAVHMALYPRHNIETFENIDLLLWHHCDGEHEKGDSCRWKEIPHYSADIGAAWLVVEKLQELKLTYEFSCTFDYMLRDGDKWCELSTADFCRLVCVAALKTITSPARGAYCPAALKAADCHEIATTGTREPTEKTG